MNFQIFMKQPINRRRAATITLVGGYVNIVVITIQGLLLVPFYLKFIGPRLYGAWLGSGEILAWLGIFDLGLASLMIQRMAKAYGQMDRQLVANYFATGLFTQIVMVLLIIIGSVVLAPWLPGWMGIEEGEAALLTRCCILTSIATGFMILNNGVAGFAQALQRTIFINIATIGSSILGLLTILFLLFADWGLLAIPVGMLVRNGALLILNSGYSAWLYRSEIHQAFQPKFNILREFVSISSAAFLSKLGSAGLGRSEAALIAIFIHPEMATMFVLTRRAADIVRLLINRFGGAVFAGFSHLVGGGQRESAAKVYAEVLVIYTGVSVVLVGTYLAVNQTFMSVWVGSEQFGGEILTILIGFNVLTGGRFGLLSYLYGATGQIARSAYIVFFESICRFALMIVLLWWIGMPGLPLAAIVTTFVAGEISQKWTVHELGVKRKIYFNINKFSQWSYLFLLIVGSYVGIFIWAKSWAGVTIMLTVTILITSVVAILSEPYFRKYMSVVKGHIYLITRTSLSRFREDIQK